jgi:hypothetical protein
MVLIVTTAAMQKTAMQRDALIALSPPQSVASLILSIFIGGD